MLSSCRPNSEAFPPLFTRISRGLRGVCPDQFKRGTRLLFLRHQHINTVYIRELTGVLDLLDLAGIDVLVLKGAALCQKMETASRLEVSARKKPIEYHGT